MTMVPWDNGLNETFRDPEFIKEYLRAAWQEEGTGGVLMALEHIAEVGQKRPQSDTAQGATFAAVYDALHTLGLELTVRPS